MVGHKFPQTSEKEVNFADNWNILYGSGNFVNLYWLKDSSPSGHTSCVSSARRWWANVCKS